MKNNLVWIGITFCLVLALTIPMVMSYVLVPQIPISITNTNDGSQESAILTSFAKAGTTCSDTDLGINPSTVGKLTFTDSDTGFNYTFNDFCVGNKLIEFGCVKDFTMNGKQYGEIAVATEMTGTTVCG